MRINIGNKIIELAEDISITIDTTRLGPRQRTSLQKMAQTGYIKGRSIPARLAAAIRVQQGHPMVHATGYDVRFIGLPTDLRKQMADYIKAAAVAAQMEEHVSDYRRQSIQRDIDHAETSVSVGYYITPQLTKILDKQLRMPIIEFTLPDKITLPAEAL